MNLSILQFNEDNISTRITTGVLNHQFLRRPYKEHFYKFKDFLPLAKEFHSAPEYGELHITFILSNLRTLFFCSVSTYINTAT